MCKEWSQTSHSLWFSHPVHKNEGKELPEQSILKACASEAAQLELWTDSEAQKEVETNFFIKLGGRMPWSPVSSALIFVRGALLHFGFFIF